MSDQEFSNETARLVHLVSQGEVSEALHLLQTMPYREATRALLRLSPELRQGLLTNLDPAQAAEVVEHLPEAEAVEVVQQIPSEKAAAILEELPSDESADLISEMESSKAESILSEMDPEEAAEARSLIQYQEDEAGGLMVTEYLKFKEEMTVSELVADLKEKAEIYSSYDVQYIYVINQGQKLVGVLRLRDLLLSPGKMRISNLMINNPLAVLHKDSLERVEEFFEEHHYEGTPVVDDQGRLVGVVQRSDLEAAVSHRNESQYLKAQGIVGGEELRTMPLGVRSRRRLSWLSVNIVLNVIAASVIAFYQDTLAAAISLAVFLPIISDMSGCSGNQAVAVSMRELSLGLVKPSEMFHVLRKEFAVGLINGFALGMLLGGVAYLWKGSLFLSLVISGAMMVNTVIAVGIGGAVPLLLRRFGKDPALASGPILTTVTDICGFFLVLGGASLVISRI